MSAPAPDYHLRDFPSHVQQMGVMVDGLLQADAIAVANATADIGAGGWITVTVPGLSVIRGAIVGENWRLPGFPAANPTGQPVCSYHIFQGVTRGDNVAQFQVWRPNTRSDWTGQAPTLEWPTKVHVSVIAFGTAVGGAAGGYPIPGMQDTVWEIPALLEAFARSVDGKIGAQSIGGGMSLHVLPFQNSPTLDTSGRANINVNVATVYGAVLGTRNPGKLAVGIHHPSPLNPAGSGKLQIGIGDATWPAPSGAGPIYTSYPSVPRPQQGGSVVVGGLYWGA